MRRVRDQEADRVRVRHAVDLRRALADEDLEAARVERVARQPEVAADLEHVAEAEVRLDEEDEVLGPAGPGCGSATPLTVIVSSTSMSVVLMPRPTELEVPGTVPITTPATPAVVEMSAPRASPIPLKLRFAKPTLVIVPELGRGRGLEEDVGVDDVAAGAGGVAPADADVRVVRRDADERPGGHVDRRRADRLGDPHRLAVELDRERRRDPDARDVDLGRAA